MKKKILLISIWTLTLLFVAPVVIGIKSSAQSQSKTLTYDLNTEGVARINYSISLTNDDPTTYIAKYTLSTGLDSIFDVIARTESGQNLSFSIRDVNETKAVEVNFPQPSHPQTTVAWNLTFSSDSPVNKVGKNLEVTVPGIASETDFVAVIKVPKEVGPVNYISSEPNEVRDDGNKWQYIFTDNAIKEMGIFASFGEEQIYDFSYKYELKNENADTKLRATITLPPDYKNQRVYFENISPSPNYGYRDTDGNTIAEYVLNPGEGFEVLINGKIVLINARNNDFTPPDLNPENYLTPDTYWESDNPDIIELAKSLIEGSPTNTEKARAIYDYIVQELTYSNTALTDINRIRLGAIESLRDKDNVICQEFTDLFIALTRAAGVPSRMLAGYTTAGAGYNLPLNTLHAWAEFYSEDGEWIAVDPTWESTSGGFNFFNNIGLNHVVLAIRGNSSQTPHLVLSFIPTDDTTDNLTIKPTIESVVEKDEIDVSLEFPDEIKTVTNSSGKIKIFNKSNQILSAIDFQLKSDLVSIKLPALDSTFAIFPGGEHTFDITITPKNSFKTATEQVELKFSAILGEEHPVNAVEKHDANVVTHKALVYGAIFISGFLTIIIVAGGIIITRFIIQRRQKRS